MLLHARNLTLDLSRPHVMGILNLTPDSFSDGGRYNQLDAALRRAEQMVAEGATLIDIGGESTRPNAPIVSEAEELDRVIPVVERLVEELPVLLSLDTSKAGVMREGWRAGIHLINDVCALRNEGALDVAAETEALICLMHMQGDPRTMQINPHYENVTEEVYSFLAERVEACIAAGIAKERLILDPGFGFGKTLEHNYQLLREQKKFIEMGLPLLVGFSRKSMISALLQREMSERLAGNVALALLGVQNGARIVRVHEIQPTMDALRIGWMAHYGYDFLR